MEAMPFAKFSYDVVHSSWVFHALFSHQLRAAYLEQNRILRPGGYMWIYGPSHTNTHKHTVTHMIPFPPPLLSPSKQAAPWCIMLDPALNLPVVVSLCCSLLCVVLVVLPGGWSFEQVDTMTHLLVDQLGYKVLFEKRNVVDTNKVKHAFDTVPYEHTQAHAHAHSRATARLEKTMP